MNCYFDSLQYYSLYTALARQYAIHSIEILVHKFLNVFLICIDAGCSVATLKIGDVDNSDHEECSDHLVREVRRTHNRHQRYSIILSVMSYLVL